MILRLILAASVFIGSQILLAMTFAWLNVNTNFVVQGHQITNGMVMFTVALVLAFMTFKKVSD